MTDKLLTHPAFQRKKDTSSFYESIMSSFNPDNAAMQWDISWDQHLPAPPSNPIAMLTMSPQEIYIFSMFMEKFISVKQAGDDKQQLRQLMMLTVDSALGLESDSSSNQTALSYFRDVKIVEALRVLIGLLVSERNSQYVNTMYPVKGGHFAVIGVQV